MPVFALGCMIAVVAIYQARDDYTVVNLEIGQKNLSRLEDLRLSSLEENRFADVHRKSVKAKLRIGDNLYSTKVRLKGDYSDHRDDPRKFSLRFVAKPPVAEIQLREFSIQHPKTRGWYWEKQLYDFARSQGLIAPKMEIVRLKRNGDDLGIMLLEEVFGQQSAHNNKRKEGVFLRFDDDLINDPMNAELYRHFRTAQIKPFDRKRVMANPNLRAQYLLGRGLLESWMRGDRKPSEIFDVDQMAKFLAVSELYAAYHGLDFSNLFFFFNPMTKLLEPVFFDANPIEGSLGAKSIHDYTFVHEILLDELILEQFVHQVRDMAPNLIQAIEDSIEKEGIRHHRLFKREFKDLRLYRYSFLKSRAERYGQIATEKPEYYLYLARTYKLEIEGVEDSGGKTNIEMMQDVAKRWIDDTGSRFELAFTDSELPSLVSISLFRDSDGVSFDAFNITNRPVTITKVVLRADDTLTELNPNLYLPAATSTQAPEFVEKVTFPDAVKLPVNAKLEVFASIEPNGRPVRHTITGISDRRPRQLIAPLLEQTIVKFPFLQLDEASASFIIPAGEWTVAEPMMLPKGMGLEIEAGAKLAFAENAGILMSGPIFVRGTADAPVQMIARDETWAGLYVVRAEERSQINHLHVSDLGANSVFDTGLTGALTFLESDVEIRFSKFHNALAEDFINIHFADLQVEGSHFSQTASDAIDIDFGTFVISRSEFEGITGDGIDFSGSVGVLRQVSFSSIGDKAISVGEQSEVSITDASVTDALVALASKDGASVKIDGLETQKLKLSPVMAYTKKPIFGPAQAYVIGLDTNGQGIVPINQDGSTLVVENVSYKGVKLDVDALYEGAMKKINVFGN